MENKDNRSKDKRNRMRQYRKKPPNQQHSKNNPNNTSSSSQVEVVRGVVDVADSSDERFVSRRGWTNSRPQTQARRYSLDDDEETDLNETQSAQMHAGDFGLMAQLPKSTGGHFQFSSEKHWGSVEGGEQLLDNTEASQYFTLNIKLLNIGLQTIPFYKRMDYPSTMFTREQVLAMEQAAEEAEKSYQLVMQEHISNPRMKMPSNSGGGSRKSGSGKSQNSSAKKPSSNAALATETNAPDELDELLNMTTAAVSKVGLSEGAGSGAENAGTPPAKGNSGDLGANNKNDIQEWLDNVLEE